MNNLFKVVNNLMYFILFKTRGRVSCCSMCMSVFGFFLVVTCFICTTALIYMHLQLKENVEKIREEVNKGDFLVVSTRLSICTIVLTRLLHLFLSAFISFLFIAVLFPSVWNISKIAFYMYIKCDQLNCIIFCSTMKCYFSKNFLASSVWYKLVIWFLWF